MPEDSPQWNFGDRDDRNEDYEANGQKTGIFFCDQDVACDFIPHGVSKHKPADNCHRAVEGELSAALDREIIYSISSYRKDVC
jgi:hypothetical protein